MVEAAEVEEVVVCRYLMSEQEVVRSSVTNYVPDKVEVVVFLVTIKVTLPKEPVTLPVLAVRD
ncbi:hypothetical protein DGG96_17405 [Legionella qingyii]|uniref:Uncharacterized protein n=1 Tax=Legionella qingyii TaxID=2184757 RepID=A0A317TZL1_9GAMM|nr:hypothetical protein [Legionella qingyii]PWY54385.1 hypothetical protein DGG96_17405 [Legionella qingyii]